MWIAKEKGNKTRFWTVVFTANVPARKLCRWSDCCVYIVKQSDISVYFDLRHVLTVINPYLVVVVVVCCFAALLNCRVYDSHWISSGAQVFRITLNAFISNMIWMNNMGLYVWMWWYFTWMQGIESWAGKPRKS